jgi:hypothetical protein
MASKEVDHLLLMDNGSNTHTKDKLYKWTGLYSDRITIYPADTMGIYAMWNMGLRIAMGMTEFPYVAFLNNDIDFDPGPFFEDLRVCLDLEPTVGIAYPGNGDPNAQHSFATVGTKKDGGMVGHAFMLRSKLMDEGLPYVDENLQWWYGDDFMEMQVRALGYQVVKLPWLRCDHENEATASNAANKQWTDEAKVRDTEYWYRTYG